MKAKFGRWLLRAWPLILLAALFLGYGFYILTGSTVHGTLSGRALTTGSTSLQNTGSIVQPASVPAGSFEGLLIGAVPDYASENENPVIVSLQDTSGGQLASWSFTKYDIGSDGYTALYLPAAIRNDSPAEYRIVISGKDSAVSISTADITGRTPELTARSEDGTQIQGVICLQFIEKSIGKLKIFAVFAILFAAALSGLLFILHRFRRLPFVFIYLYIVIMIVSCFTVLPFESPDEMRHFWRSYEISEGSILSSFNDAENDAGAYLPEAVASFSGCMGDIHDTMNMRLSNLDNVRNLTVDESAPRMWAEMDGSVVYSPTSYLPQAAGIAVTRIFTKNVLAMYYGGRIMNALVIGALLFLALMIIPYGQMLMFVIAFFPMLLQQYNSYSADGFCVALSFLLLAFVLRKRQDAASGKMMTAKDMALMYFLSFFLGLAKVVYCAICLLYLLIPRKCFRTLKNYILQIGLTLAVIAVPYLIWTKISSGLLAQYLAALSWNVDQKRQLGLLMGAPLSFIGKVIDVSNRNRLYIFDMIGRKLGWLNIDIDIFLLFISTVLVIMAMVYRHENESVSFGIRERLCLYASFILVVLLIFLSEYLTWTSYGRSLIDGVQGRYFLPVLPVLLIAVKSKNPGFALPDGKRTCMVTAVFGICACTMLRLFAFAV